MRITGGLRVTGGLSVGPNTGSATLPVLRWDPSFVDTNNMPILISPDGTQVVDEAPGDYSIISTNTIPRTGAYMFTVRMDFDTDAQLANPPDVGGFVGVGNTSFNPLSGLGSDTNSYGFTDQGNAIYDNTPQTGGLPNFNFLDGAVIDVAILDNTYIWIRVNGGDWNNNSNSNLLDGTGGLSVMSALSSTDIRPMVTCAGSMGPTQFTILPTSPYGVPSGVTFFNMYTPPPSNGVTINILDLAAVISGPIVGGDSYVNGGGWDYVTFVQPALYNAFTSMIGGTNFVPLNVQWAAGSDMNSGLVFIEFSGNPYEFQFVTVTDPSASTPQSGTFKFPATFTLVV